MNKIISYIFVFLSTINISLSFAVPPVPEVIYRLDTRSPDIIFSNGFESWGNNRELLPHLFGSTIRDRTDGLISTSASIESIERLAINTMPQDDDTAWLYTIVPGTGFYNVNDSLINSVFNQELSETIRNQSLNMFTRFNWQHEFVSAAGSISRDTIINARQVRWVNGSIDIHNTELRDNPNFNENLYPAINPGYLIPNQIVNDPLVNYMGDYEDNPISLPFSLDGCLDLLKKGPVCKSVPYSVFKESVISELNGRLFVSFLNV